MKSVMIFFGKIIFLLRRHAPPQNPRRIVIFKIGAIGDVLMSTPFVRRGRESYPDAKITYVVGNWSAPVLAGSPFIDEIIAFDDSILWGKKWSGILQLLRTMRSLHADLGFVLDRHYFAALFAFFGGIRYRVGFDRNGEGFANNTNVPYGPIRHEIEYNLDLLRVLGHQIDDAKMEVFLSKEDITFADRYLEKHHLRTELCIGIMPGGAKNPGQEMLIRRWPLDYYQKFLQRAATDLPNSVFLLFGGPKDRTTNEVLCAELPQRAYNTAGEATIKQSMALMRRCSVFVTHDSGPMHMAAAGGVPVISIFGPVHPERKAPRGKEHRYIWKPDKEGALCDNEGVFPKSVTELPCMRAVTPEEVFRALKDVLAEEFRIEKNNA